MNNCQEPRHPIIPHRLFFATIVALLAASAVAGCATTVPRCEGPSPAVEAEEARSRGMPISDLTGPSAALYGKVRDKIDTRAQFHNAVLATRSYKTPFSFYLLGFEKPRNCYDRPYCASADARCTATAFEVRRFKGSATDNEAEIQKTREDINERLFGDKRSIVLTHALRVDKASSGTNDQSQDGCFVFNVYADVATAPWCKHRHIVQVDKPMWSREGWRAMDRLADEIKEAAVREKTTHIVLLATGWNTEEYESFLDFSYWMTRLAEDFSAKGQVFRPMFVGIAWESEWASSFWSKLPFSSWTTKGNDADEIGYGWANYLLNDVLRPAAQASDARLIAIGHSFGSRIVLGAHYVRNIHPRNDSRASVVPVTLIGMQAAFPTGRFISSKGKEHQYVSANKGASTVVITTSEYDEANGAITVGTGYVGGPGGLSDLRDAAALYNGVVTQIGTSANGQPLSPPDKTAVSVYDATPFVKCELQGTASGAHSDVYDQEMGHFLGEIIRASVQ